MKPAKPVLVQLLIRLTPKLHQAIKIEAAKRRTTIQAIAEKALEQEVSHAGG